MNTLSRGQRVQAVLFLIVGITVVVAACFFLIGAPLFTAPKPRFIVRFAESIAGVEPGTAVKYRGVKMGKVEAISIDDKHDEVEILLEVDPDLRVTKTTMAKIASQGLLGPYFIELSGSSEGSPELPPMSRIPTDDSTMRRIIEAGTTSMEKLGPVLRNLERLTGPENEKRLQDLLEATTRLANTTNATIERLDPEARRVLKSWADLGTDASQVLHDNVESLDAIVKDTRAVVASVRRYLEEGHLERLTDETTKTMQTGRAEISRVSSSITNWVNEDRIGTRVSDAVAALERLEKQLHSVISVLETEVVTVSRSELSPTLRGFRDAVRDLGDLVRVLRNDPSLVILSQPRGEVTIPERAPPPEPKK